MRVVLSFPIPPFRSPVTRIVIVMDSIQWCATSSECLLFCSFLPARSPFRVSLLHGLNNIRHVKKESHRRGGGGRRSLLRLLLLFGILFPFHVFGKMTFFQNIHDDRLVPLGFPLPYSQW